MSNKFRPLKAATWAGLLSCMLALSVAAEGTAGCEAARVYAKHHRVERISDDKRQLDSLLEVYPPFGCVAPHYFLQLGVAQLAVGEQHDTVKKNLKKALKQAKQGTVLGAHALAWLARTQWESVDENWAEEAKGRERGAAYKEASTAKAIYNREYPGQEPSWFDDYLLNMGEQLVNPSVESIVAQLDIHSASRAAIATESAGSVELRINFEQNSDRLSQQSLAVVDNLLTAVDQLKGTDANHYQLALVGHTSTEGDEDFNQDLSERRAQAVKQAILAQRPQLSARVRASGKGESSPVYSPDNVELKQRANRRVEVRLGVP